MRSRVALSDGARLRSAWTKCQKSAASPEMRVPARFDSSLATRNGDRALRPRSERSSAIDATVDVKQNYTLRGLVNGDGRFGPALGALRPGIVVRAPLPWHTVSLTIMLDPKPKSTAPAHTASIARTIVILRGQKVLLDADLALLFGVPTKRLNEQVRRNANRFPADFLFRLTDQEVRTLRSQVATSNPRRGGRRYLPYAFTEHGAIMAATILNSPRAIEVSVYVVRAFVQLREVLATHRQLAERLDILEAKIESKLATHDSALADIINAIRELMAPPDSQEATHWLRDPKAGAVSTDRCQRSSES